MKLPETESDFCTFFRNYFALVSELYVPNHENKSLDYIEFYVAIEGKRHIASELHETCC